MTQISSLTGGYQPGYLSIYPTGMDDKISLYQVTNNATTQLKQSLPYNGNQIIVTDASGFPDQGILRIGPQEGKPGKVVIPDTSQLINASQDARAGNAELIYYGTKTGNTFTGLIRGFAGSRQNIWSANSYCTNGVMAEHHNAIKDAILNMEKNLGIEVGPGTASLNGILKSLETRFLSPKPQFRASPRIGAPPLSVRFQNFSGGDPVRYLWDFGDGVSSSELSPTHTYTTEGIYTVSLIVITTLNAQGVATKSNYITISNEEGILFFYTDAVTGMSVQTAIAATSNADNAKTFTFVDQSEGPIIERIWNFDDTNRTTVTEPNDHSITHRYLVPGTYRPTLLLVFDNLRTKTVSLNDDLEVS